VSGEEIPAQPEQPEATPETQTPEQTVNVLPTHPVPVE
jgi:hypothetical protein